MKKLLALVSSVLLVGGTSMSVVACGNTTQKETEKEDFSAEKFLEIFGEYTKEKNKTVEVNVEFKEGIVREDISRAIVAKLNSILNEKNVKSMDNDKEKVAFGGNWIPEKIEITDGYTWDTKDGGTDLKFMVPNPDKDGDFEVARDKDGKEIAVKSFSVSVKVGKGEQPPVDETDKEKIERLTKELSDLQKQYDEKEDAYNKAVADRDEANGKLEKALGELGTTKEELDKTKSDLADANKAKEEAEAQITNLEAQIAELKKDAFNNSAKIKLLEATLVVLRNGYKEATDKIADLEKQLGELPETVKRLEEDLKISNKHIEDLMEIRASLINKIEDLKNKLYNLRQENNHLMVNLSGTLLFDELNKGIEIRTTNSPADDFWTKLENQLILVFGEVKNNDLLKDFDTSKLNFKLNNIYNNNINKATINYTVSIGEFEFSRTQTINVTQKLFSTSDKKLARERAVHNLNLTGDKGKGKDINLDKDASYGSLFGLFGSKLGKQSIAMFYEAYYTELAKIKGEILGKNTGLTETEKAEAQKEIVRYAQESVSLVYIDAAETNGSRKVLHEYKMTVSFDKDGNPIVENPWENEKDNKYGNLLKEYNFLHDKYGKNDKEYKQSLALKFGGVTSVGSYWTFTFSNK